MVTLLSKLWIKSDNYKDSKVREKYGVLCGAVGIFLNVLLVNFILDGYNPPTAIWVPIPRGTSTNVQPSTVTLLQIVSS